MSEYLKSSVKLIISSGSLHGTKARPASLFGGNDHSRKFSVEPKQGNAQSHCKKPSAKPKHDLSVSADGKDHPRKPSVEPKQGHAHLHCIRPDGRAETYSDFSKDLKEARVKRLRK